MKKIAIIGLSLMLFCFISGGIYIVKTIFDVTDKLEKVISFQRVEILRDNLVHHIKSAQSDILLQGSPHQSETDASVEYISEIETVSNLCLDCHHTSEVTVLLKNLKASVQEYMALISRTLTIQGNPHRLAQARTEAFARGERLLDQVTSLSIASAHKISSRIDKIRADINKTNYFLIACLILGPIPILFLVFFLFNRFKGSIDILVESVSELGKGDLNYRIDTPLKDEFATLAEAFNSMAASLSIEREKFTSANTLYQTLFESAGDSIMITSLENGSMGQIFSANRAACDMYGYSVDELLGMKIVNLSPEQNIEEIISKVNSVLTGEWIRSRLKRRRKDGTLFWVDASFGLLHLGQKKFLLSFSKDISESLRAEEEQQRANQMALVGQMAAGLAHEIKNPLAGIKVGLDVLKGDLDLKAEDQEVFARVINEVVRMERLLRVLLNYARPPEPQFDLVDLNELLDNSIRNAEMSVHQDPAKKIIFKTDFSPNLPIVNADSAQLQQVFLNILLNAADAIEGEGVVTAVTYMDGEEVVLIELLDTGVGIDEAALEKIFNPFFTKKRKGTGLGLSICKRLIEQHHGTIEATSRVGAGTRFIIRIPTAQNKGNVSHG